MEVIREGIRTYHMNLRGIKTKTKKNNSIVYHDYDNTIIIHNNLTQLCLGVYLCIVRDKSIIPNVCIIFVRSDTVGVKSRPCINEKNKMCKRNKTKTQCRSLIKNIGSKKRSTINRYNE